MIKYGFLLILLLGSNIGIKDGIKDELLLGIFLRFKDRIEYGLVMRLLIET